MKKKADMPENSTPDILSGINQRTEELFRIPNGEPDENGQFMAPIIILRESVLFPKMISPIFIGQQKNMTAIHFALEMETTAIMLIPKDTANEDPHRLRDFNRVGLETAVGRLIPLPDNNFSSLVQGRRRVYLEKIISTDPLLMGLFSLVDEKIPEGKKTEATVRLTRDLFEQCVTLDRKVPDEALPYSATIDEPGWLADMIASSLSFNTEERQKILFEINPLKRLQILNGILTEELDLLQTTERISQKVQSGVDKTQREYYLREQARAIQEELGEGDVYSRELNELKEKIDAAPFNEEVRKVAMKEFERLTQMAPMSPEVSVSRTYIDWLLDVPWDQKTEDNLDVLNAEELLNRDHYGLEKVKERVLEYIAVKSLHPKKERQPILCFVGPPGTGKTSIGRSIAESLGRNFQRISLGGVNDEAEIRGHRRTYIGSLPGRIIQTMKKAGTINPLFMLDEIDKLGNDYRGDPASALLEVLDPEQNHAFADHFLEVDYDLSNVLFITTANTTSTIPDALLDRMEVIEFDGYVEEDKLKIARSYLLPRQMEENGLEEADIDLTDEGMKKLIREYTYESGVRNLEREIGKVCRKIARKKAEGKEYDPVVSDSNLEALMGPPYFFQSEAEKKDEIGVATGMAWTSAGGDITTVEVLTFEGKGEMEITGQIGDVMQESAKAALSYVKSRAKDFGIKPALFEKLDIHIHVPEGAVPKDGPSAGVTLATALISALTETPVRKDVAMTGEITLRGTVLPVGGIREKLLAARRLGIKTILIPEKNMKDLVDLPQQARDDLTVLPMAKMEQVIEQAFGGVKPKRKTVTRTRKTADAKKTAKPEAEA